MTIWPIPPAITQLTTGGLQFWTDHAFRGGYRLQQHALTKGWRVLDASNYRQISGSRQACEDRLEELVSSESWSQLEEPFVVLLHGLMRSSHCMNKLHRHLRDAGFEHVLRFSYASTRASVLAHAQALVEYVESLPGHSPLLFVGHSMGNIVLRAAIGQWTQRGDPLAVLPRMRGVVMLGPPNQGACIARRLSKTGIFGLLQGPGAMELGPRWSDIRDQLGTPPCPFAILAGDLSETLIRNPLVDGAGDFLVGVEEAKLDGATEFVTMPIPHAMLMTDRRALEFTTDFLQQHAGAASEGQPVDASQ